jgi:hypothetical protein
MQGKIMNNGTYYNLKNYHFEILVLFYLAVTGRKQQLHKSALTK